MESNIVDELSIRYIVGENVVPQGIQAAASKHAAIAYRSWGFFSCTAAFYSALRSIAIQAIYL